MVTNPAFQLKFSQVPALHNLELLHASNVTHEYPRHMHEDHSIAVVLKGRETTSTSDAHVATAGSVILINAEQVHSNKSKQVEYRVMKIRPQVLNQIASDLSGRKVDRLCFPQVVVNDRVLFRSLLDLQLKLEQYSSLLEHESEFISTISLLLTTQARGQSATRLVRVGKEDRYVRIIRDYLKSHYAENVSLSQLSTITNLSPYYLLRVFHTHVGFPPHEYQTQVRIGHARKLIRRGCSFSQTAQETGFFDQSHLCRNFKRILGITPRQYLSQSKPAKVSSN